MLGAVASDGILLDDGHVPRRLALEAAGVFIESSPDPDRVTGARSEGQIIVAGLLRDFVTSSLSELCGQMELAIQLGRVSTAIKALPRRAIWLAADLDQDSAAGLADVAGLPRRLQAVPAERQQPSAGDDAVAGPVAEPACGDQRPRRRGVR